jgi:hypothetical protein
MDIRLEHAISGVHRSGSMSRATEYRHRTAVAAEHIHTTVHVSVERFNGIVTYIPTHN